MLRAPTRQLFPLLALLLIALVSNPAMSKPKYVIKFASVAPEGSTWMNVMYELDTAVRDSTDGQVGFKMYAGGVQGDEPDVLRKMRFSQLHAAGFTGVGLGEVLPSMRVLELPFLYENKDEVDYILDKFTDYFDQAFREKGYVLLGWTEVGSVYFFSTTPIRTLDDLAGKKVWSWQGDPLAAALFKALKITPVPLSLPEVLTGLQTGMVDAFYTAPMAAVSLQWFTRVSYMNKEPLTNSMGAVLLAKPMWDKIPPEYQKQLLQLSRQKLRELTLLTRKDNAQALEIMADQGIQMLPPPPEESLAKYRLVGKQVREELEGQLYSADLLNRIEKALEDYRAQ